MKTLHYSIIIVVGISGTVIVWGLFYPIVISTNPSNMLSGTISVENTTSSVNYSITHATILRVYKVADQQPNALVFNINATGDGNLSVTIPRSLLDSKNSDGTDNSFAIFTSGGGSSVDFTEIEKTSLQRTISFPFTKSTVNIEIIVPSH
jgi:hypothetical protein